MVAAIDEGDPSYTLPFHEIRPLPCAKYHSTFLVYLIFLSPTSILALLAALLQPSAQSPRLSFVSLAAPRITPLFPATHDSVTPPFPGAQQPAWTPHFPTKKDSIQHFALPRPHPPNSRSWRPRIHTPTHPIMHRCYRPPSLPTCRVTTQPSGRVGNHTSRTRTWMEP